MEDPALLEWIDQYLMGNIRPQDKAELERMMASDPEIAELVKESRMAFNVLKTERNRLLRDKLRQLDKEETRRSGFLPKWIVLSLCILVILGGSWFWASYYFSNKAIAERYFKMSYNPEEELFLSPDMKTIWEEAGQAFRNEDFGQASNLYNSIMDNTHRSVLYSVRWNLLLSDLALHGQTVQWKQALKNFTDETPASYGIRAQELSRLLNSGWYRIVAFFTQTDISGLKPRLI